MNRTIQARQTKLSSEMMVITPKTEPILVDIQSIFQHPYHYTYVIQKNDNYIYLYDQLTMEIIGRTHVQFETSFRNFTFTDNFNVFIAYHEGKSNPHQQPQLIKFTLNSDGLINHERKVLLRNQKPQNLMLYSIDYHQRSSPRQGKQKERQGYIVGISNKKIHYITLDGQIVKETDLFHDGRDLNILNAFIIKQNKWIFIEANMMYFATVTEKYTIDQCLRLESKVSSIFRGPSLKAEFMAYVTEQHTIAIMIQIGELWSVQYNFKVPNINIRKVCMYFPAPNTSTTHQFKDKLFLLIHGDPLHFYDQRSQAQLQFSKYQQQKIDSAIIPRELLRDTHLYAYEYSIKELTSPMKPQTSLLKNSFCLKNIGKIKYSIWTNEHAQNQIRLFNQNKQIISVDLLPLLQQKYAGKEWVCLGYKFQGMSQNRLYEQTEDNFQNVKPIVKTVNMKDINDWSYSLFPKESILGHTVKRLDCLQF